MSKGRTGGNDLADLLTVSLAPVDEQGTHPGVDYVPEEPAADIRQGLLDPQTSERVEAVAAPAPAPAYSGVTANLAARVPVELKADFDLHLLKTWQETKGRKLTVQEALPALVQLLLEDPDVEAKWRAKLGR